ncbi:MAG: DUF4345 family protein [Myxococcales bacterium]|nr:DUF4345 family protein [Myxococcales bacterium]
MLLGRILVSATGFAFVSLGTTFAAFPRRFALRVGLVARNADALADVRAIYGGLEIGVGLFLIWCALSPRRAFAGAVLGVLVMAAIVGSRAAGSALVPGTTSMTTNALLLESLALVLNGLAAWLLRPRSSAELPAEA